MPLPLADDRLNAIAQARRHIMGDGLAAASVPIEPWVIRSWQRCLAWGLQAQREVVFEQVSAASLKRTLEANRKLVLAARPVLEQLGRAIVDTRYFAILTNAQGVVVDTSGAIDHSDPHAHLITRVGTDLSERSIGTTAIGATLAEQQSVWLHRGEHFFDAHSVYSCAGAPLFGPHGQCVGMLDVTGIHAVERPELKHLVTQSAARIENTLLLRSPHALLLRLNWPGNAMGSDSDGLLCLNDAGQVTGSNSVARRMVAHLPATGATSVHVSDLFGVAVDLLFDAAHKPASIELPLWSGLRLLVQAISPANEDLAMNSPSASRGLPLRDVETALIRKAITEARGNVLQAAKALGISRATVYRKLGQRPGH